MTRGEKVIRWIETRCIVPEGALVGQPVQLAEFQRRFLLDVYDSRVPTRTAILSVGRKNAKTATIAMLCLAHIDGPEARRNSEILSGARSRDQAALVFRYASKMVMMSPKLRKRIKIIPSKKTLLGLAANVEYHAISAEAGTAHGLSPVLAILDEPGQVRGPYDDFFEAITTSQGAHKDPMLVYIGTQAPTDADYLSLLIDDAITKKPPGVVCHLYAADLELDVTDPRAWQQANPALGIFRSREDVEALAHEASRMPSKENSFRNLILNQRVSADALFCSRSVWESCGERPVPLEPTAETYCGLDLSSRADLTAFVAIQKIGNVWNVHPFFWTPAKSLLERAKRDRVEYDVWARNGELKTTPGATVDYDYVVTDIAEILSGLEDLKWVAFDRWRMDVFKKSMETIGVEFPMQPFGQGFKDMGPALDNLEAELLNGRIAHGMHPVLTMCASNAISVKDPAGARKLDKARSTGRIDGMVALAMAIGVVFKIQEEEEEDGLKVYESRGILVL